MRVVIPTTIKKVERKKRIARAWRINKDDVHVEEEDIGWAILMEGSYEWLFIGHEQPDLQPGDKVRIIISNETVDH